MGASVWGAKRPSVITSADRARAAGNWQVAADHYATALRRNPHNGPIWIQHGHALRESGRVAEAEQSYRQAISCNQQDPDGHLHLGHALKLQMKSEAAISSYLRAAALGAGFDATEGLRGLGWGAAELAELRYAITGDVPRQGEPGAVGEFKYDPSICSGSLAAPVSLTDLAISAVIPLYNGAAHIAEAVRSVERQTLRPRELVIVDDGSTDDSVALVEAVDCAIPIRLLRKENGGQSSARNHGIRNSTGELIALLDQDDIWYPHHLERLAEPFLEQRYPALGWTYSNLDFTANGRIISVGYVTTVGVEHPKRSLVRCLREDMHILPSASLISREAFDRVGGFDERLSGYEDDDLFLRLFCLGYGNVFIDEPLSQWRQHATNAGRSPRMAKSRLAYMRKLIDGFPDDEIVHHHYARDIIGPRFVGLIIDQYRHAVAMGAVELRDATIEHLALLRRSAPDAIPEFIRQTHEQHALAVEAGDADQIAGMERLLGAI